MGVPVQGPHRDLARQVELARVAALWGVTRFQVYRALKRHGIEETLIDEADEGSEESPVRPAGGCKR